MCEHNNQLTLLHGTCIRIYCAEHFSKPFQRQAFMCTFTCKLLRVYKQICGMFVFSWLMSYQIYFVLVLAWIDSNHY